MKIKKTLSTWLVQRYQLIIRNEENFEERRAINYTPAKLLAILIPAISIIFIVGFFVGKKILERKYQGGFRESDLTRKVVALSSVVDSLTEQMQKQENYYGDLKKVLSGDTKLLKQDTLQETTKKNITEKVDTNYISAADLQLRKEYEGVNISNEDSENTFSQELREIFFFSPIMGVISEKYDAKTQHYGIDVVAKKNEPVRAVADGTVIMASWTDDTGHVIAIQHRANVISLYKHNAVLLKKVGDFVKSGETIAIIGDTGKYSTGAHLHFELWYKGNPINPESFIVF